ncbi:hypothetical protein SAMN04488511_103322 [Pedobacter suwonensis]|uniref:DUF4157 domain-containing protein n=1 Tax=Pedobacter suwonensis TaxID=332999 RepID=A0A1I0SUY8_9SPHI|nr:hypothetical protein [Pedobacter suwonensis]SFA43345.1 hypothetical protein SAMN04488511_103322 [Pedobacter suwonensis]
MNAPVLIVKKLPAAGMAIFPFILLKSAAFKNDQEIINHEKIHLRQQLELLVFPFYILYLLNYLINLIRYKKHNLAYRNIVFEKEAYTHETDLNYLKKGNWYGWIKIR